MATWERQLVTSYNLTIASQVAVFRGDIYWTTTDNSVVTNGFSTRRWNGSEESEIGNFGIGSPSGTGKWPALTVFKDRLYVLFQETPIPDVNVHEWQLWQYVFNNTWEYRYSRTYDEDPPDDSDQLQLFCADDNYIIYVIHDQTNETMKVGFSPDGVTFQESFVSSPSLDTAPIYLIENHNSSIVGSGRYGQRYPSRAYMYAHGGADSGAYRFSGGGWIRHGGDWGDWDGSGQNLGPVNGDRVWRYHKGKGNWEYSNGAESFAGWSDMTDSQRPIQSIGYSGTAGFSSNNVYLWDNNGEDWDSAEALSGGTLSVPFYIVRRKNGDSYLVGYNGSNQLEIYQRSESLPAPSTLYAELWQDQNGVGAERKSELPFEGVATGAMAVKKNLDVIVGSNVSGETMVVKGVAGDDYHDLSDITDNIETSTGIERIEVIDG